MKRLVAGFLASVLVIACSPSFSARVGPFSTPIATSLGRICWTAVDATGAPAIRTATFTATATYDPSVLPVTDSVELQVFGRAGAPAGECTDRNEATDVVLSEPFELEREVSQPIEVGGAAYGTDLADLVGEGTFWIGASASGNVGLGDERVLFEDGRITVRF